jgi:hypothetical protein
MALAYLRYEDSDGRHCHFRFDLGRNRYFAWTIGEEETEVRDGLRVLSQRQHLSPIFGPIAESDEGRGELDIPCSFFDRDHRHVQLFSFRTRDRVGPAVSAILEISPGGWDGPGNLDENALPEVNFSSSNSIVNATLTNPGPADALSPGRRVCRRAARLHRRPPLARAQDFGLGAILGTLGQSLLGSLPNLLPQIIPAATAAIGQLSPQANTAFNNRPTQDALTTVVQAILAAIGQPAATAPATAPGTTPGNTTPAGAAAPVIQASTPGTFSLTTRPLRSQAMIAPALLAALPALMPLLQQVLSPQTIQGVLQTADPNRLLNTLGQLGLQVNQQEIQHLERLNPGVEDPMLAALLTQMSTHLREEAPKVRFRRVKGVSLQFIGVTPLTMAGRPVVAYQLGRDWDFPLSLTTPRPTAPGQLRIVIKNARSLKPVAENRQKTPPLSSGPVSIINRFAADQLHGLRAGEDYLVCAYLSWKNKAGERLGTEMSQLIRAVDPLTFDGVDEDGETIALNDVDKFRDFWHQAWTSNFSRDLIRVNLECLYYYLLCRNEVDNAQLETTVRTEEKGLHRRQLRVETGLLLSPNRLNELLPKISSHPALDEKELAALLTPDFQQHVRLAARTSGNLAGRPGQTAALWVFPEVKVKKILLQSAAEVDEHGLVRRLEPRVVFFPIPVLAHFVGARSQ